MTEKKTDKVGDLVPVKEGAKVTWPDGNTRVVTGGSLILDQAGTWTVEGIEVIVK